MKREIKFRGKSTEDGKWIYGYYFSFKPFKDVRHYIRIGNTSYQVDETSVGQFTGIVDRSGREVYEGDVYEHGGWIDVVKWNDVTAGFGLYGVKQNKWDDYSPKGLLTATEKSSQYLGNIHENHELLNK